MSCFFLVLVVMWASQSDGVDWAAEEEAKALLQQYNQEAQPVYNNSTKLAWNYNTNMTDYNRRAQDGAAIRSREFMERWNNRSNAFLGLDLTPETRRIMKKTFKVQLTAEDAKNLTQILSTMSTIYSKGTVCVGTEECLNLEPGLSDIMANSRNYTELQTIWATWRKNVARKIRPHYMQYLELMNRQARLNNYTDAGESWRQSYETDNFEEEILQLYKEVEPLYRLLHSYVRRKLRDHYPQIDPKGPLPACVLGDMWGRFWTNIDSLVTPYPAQPALDVTEAMLEKNFTVNRMFEMGDEFFTSMGLKPVPDTFWTRSMLVRPEGREVVCHASAWDFYDGKDFRIKMCTIVNMENLQTIHHELGHVQYFMQYAHLPIMYRDGANDGFHEAIGELMTLAMSTPQHLAKVGLLHDLAESHELSINYLMRTALHSVTTLPFHLVNDLWRWRVWSGQYKPEEYNEEFWKLKEKYLGVVAPVNRTSEDLDPPALFHIANNYDMMRYFTRTILQFQILEALCQAAGQTGPLHTCDFYRSKEAGTLLASGLSLGASKAWPDVLHTLTGQRRLSSAALRRYFEPLESWLRLHNDKAGAQGGGGTGWGHSWTFDTDSVSAASYVNTGVVTVVSIALLVRVLMT